MKFVAYVALIFLYESCKFGEKISYSNWDNEFFLRDCFLLAHPVDFAIAESYINVLVQSATCVSGWLKVRQKRPDVHIWTIRVLRHFVNVFAPYQPAADISFLSDWVFPAIRHRTVRRCSFA